jgi:ribose transport system substrate-binding protein
MPPSKQQEHNARDSVQAVIRAIGILKAFRNESERLLLSDLVERTGLRKTTTFRLVQTLVEGGLVARVGKGAYQTLVCPLTPRTVRIGFASQTDSEFSRDVTASMHRAASRDHVRLVTVNNSYSAKKALVNAELLIREHVDLVIEFQTYERVAPIIASKFLEANIPVIALEIPHPGATYFGANNYQAGLIGGRALGRWAKENWNGEVDEILVLELPIAGSLPQLRINGLLGGLRQELKDFDSIRVVHLDGKGGFERNFDLVRTQLRRRRPRKTLVGAINDTAALGALRAFEEAGATNLCAVMGQNGIKDARMELRRRGSRLVGTVAYFPERYGDELIPLAISMLEKKPLPDAVFVKHQLLTARNVDLVYPLDQ